MKRRTKELKKKIANRETEIQRYYDLCQSNLVRLEAERNRLLDQLQDIDTEEERYKDLQSRCMTRAEEQDCLDVLF